MHSYDYDLLVLGAGSGGVRAARLAAELGKKVAIVEESRIGGTCVNRGCVPKKLMVYASEYSETFAASSSFGWQGASSANFDWVKFMQVKSAELDRLEGLYKSNLESSEVKLFHAHAKFFDAHTLELDNGDKITADKILIAVGAKSNMPAAIKGIDYCITSTEALELSSKPDSIIIYGGGYIAVEFANILHGLGVKTTLVYRGNLILRGFDEDLRQLLSDYMIKKGIQIIYSEEILEVNDRGSHKEAILKDNTVLTAQNVLVALGRKPNLEDLGLQAAGVNVTDNGSIKVDDYLVTSQPHIYALGDAINRLQLAPVAIHEAISVVKTMFRNIRTQPDYEMVPSAVFSQPEIGTVGLTEEEARITHRHVDVYKVSFRPMRNIISGSEEKMFIKFLVDEPTQEIIGVHVLGAGAAELIQLIAVAAKSGVTKSDFNRTMAVHPTAAEEFVLAYTPTYSYFNGIKQ